MLDVFHSTVRNKDKERSNFRTWPVIAAAAVRRRRGGEVDHQSWMSEG